MELQMNLPNHYVELEQDEMMYLEGGGWIAWAFAVTGGVASSVAGAIAGAAAGAAVGTITLPLIGSVSCSLLGGVVGAAAAYSAGHMTAYDFGRSLEKKFFGWY